MRGRSGYVAAITLVVAGVGLGTLIFLQQLGGIEDRLQQVVVPGDHEIAFGEAGGHTIFHEERSAVAGRYFAGGRHLNGLQLRLRPLSDGAEIAITPAASRARYVLGDRAGDSIATFQIAHPGTYRLSAWYPDGATDSSSVLAIGHGVERRLLAATIGSAGAGLAGFIGGAVIAMTTFKRRRRRST